ncbi:hypothetical protein HYPBUDRAFT_151662 [Hyphopichia burtonii NRRL Y-1933]|uniref:R3H domain-containing protein n=1 Tax=Hyphopichia burtonii NRRL Y-1933 TaxID=984485 RepID=A0A1E4RT99_9ASCO|nr:hypothetical protein HYPBUDRAFT_151662 [Hyphopichia burtonii NRRL Y-1933]ODV70275.1 hypothetical protein HYPBUDRAFT_151662 [Hyphopichia burtonii NRRL Y-1933]
MEDARKPVGLPKAAQDLTSRSSFSSEDVLSRNSSSDDINIIIHPEQAESSNSNDISTHLHKHAELSEGSSVSASTENLPPLVSDTEEGNESSDASDSSDEDELNESLSTTIIQEIQDGVYTCLVCTCEIDNKSTIWSCDNCYRVYDLDCIKDWSIRGSSTANKKWRCPACNIEHNKIPNRFTCWCGRVTNPDSNSLIPFSCGNTCNYKYDDCIHSCASMCHPGQHPVCGALGPLMKCHCGKSERQLPCMITPYESGWKCPQPCETELCDLGHTCSIKECHSGLCGQCKERVTTKCYCGKNDKDIYCHERDPKICYKDNKEFIGGSKCNDTVILSYDCEVHFEELSCQPLPSKAPVCKYSPEVVRTCYCGKTSVEDASRTKCTDPMPECDNVCGKTLKCGCTCLAKCHPGECICYNIIDTKCQCGNNSFLVPCKFLQDKQLPRCTHKCPVLLNCRRHYHREVCCPSEQAALKREREKKKQIRNRTRANFDDELMSMEPIHICTRTCNRLKLCGQHYCEALCHNGPCGVCLESSNEDLICDCGKTVIPAPVRCGTKIECHEQCTRPKECGHPQDTHECHDDLKPCPKCTKLVTKSCNCGLRKEIPNVICSQTNVSCGKICTVNKACGHQCSRVCSQQCVEGVHAPVESCQAICHKVRSTCPHFCKLKCHILKKGTCDNVQCKEQVTLKCECGRRSKKTVCGSSINDSTCIGNILDCDELCSQAKRDAELKAAFGVQETNENPYPEAVTKVYERQRAWCSKIELAMLDFISDYEDEVASGIPNPKKLLHFGKMNKPQRAFVHALAETYKLYSESQDPEPNRSVFIVITKSTTKPGIKIEPAILKDEEFRQKQVREKELQQLAADDAYFNAIVIQDVFFGIVKEDIEKAVDSIMSSFKHKDAISMPTLQWMTESTYILYDKASYKEMNLDRENILYMLMKSSKQKLRDQLIAFDCKLCMVDEAANTILKIDENSVVPQRNEVIKEKQSLNSFDALAIE